MAQPSPRSLSRMAATLSVLLLVGGVLRAAEISSEDSEGSKIRYVAVGKKMPKYLHEKIVIAYDDLSFLTDKLKLTVQFENTTKTAFTLHVQTFFLDGSGKRLNDQTPREIVKVPLNGMAEYQAIALNAKAQQVEVHVSLLKTGSTNRRRGS